MAPRSVLVRSSSIKKEGKKRPLGRAIKNNLYAFCQAATILEQFTAAIAYLGSQCAADIETHCSDIAMGEGRVLACLADNEAEVSDACNQAISDTVAE